MKEYKAFLDRLRLSTGVNFQLKKKEMERTLEIEKDPKKALNDNKIISEIQSNKNILYACAKQENIPLTIKQAILTSPVFDEEIGLKLLENWQSLSHADVEKIYNMIGAKAIKKAFDIHFNSPQKHNEPFFSDVTISSFIFSKKMMEELKSYPLAYTNDALAIKMYEKQVGELSEYENTLIAGNKRLKDKRRDQYADLGINFDEVRNMTEKMKQDYADAMIEMAFLTKPETPDEEEKQTSALTNLYTDMAGRMEPQWFEERVFEQAIQKLDDVRCSKLAQVIAKETTSEKVIDMFVKNAEKITDNNLWMAMAINKNSPPEIINTLIQQLADSIKIGTSKTILYHQQKIEKLLYETNTLEKNTPISLQSYRILIQLWNEPIQLRLATTSSTPNIVLTKLITTGQTDEIKWYAQMNKFLKENLPDRNLGILVLNKLRAPKNMQTFMATPNEYKVIDRAFKDIEITDSNINDAKQSIRNMLKQSAETYELLDKNPLYEIKKTENRTFLFRINIDYASKLSMEELVKELSKLPKNVIDNLESRLITELDIPTSKPLADINFLYNIIDKYNHTYIAIKEVIDHHLYKPSQHKFVEKEEESIEL